MGHYSLFNETAGIYVSVWLCWYI